MRQCKGKLAQGRIFHTLSNTNAAFFTDHALSFVLGWLLFGRFDYSRKVLLPFQSQTTHTRSAGKTVIKFLAFLHLQEVITHHLT